MGVVPEVESNPDSDRIRIAFRFDCVYTAAVPNPDLEPSPRVNGALEWHFFIGRWSLY